MSQHSEKKITSMDAAMYEQQDPFNYGYKEYDYNIGIGGYNAGFPLQQQHENNPNCNATPDRTNLDFSGDNWDSPPPHHATATSSSEATCGGGDGFFPEGGEAGYARPMATAARRKRRRMKSFKNQEEMENQRMTHIAVERNRRRQMNDYLAVLRSLMPPSYAQRGDQASIVGGAINFVKELEQLQQFLEAHKLTESQRQNHHHHHQTNAATAPNTNTNTNTVFSNFFTFPQYSMTQATNSPGDMAVEKRSNVADIEVSMVESHANIKILSRRRPKQLLRMVSGFQSMCLAILHLNITTVGQSVLYSFSVKVDDECRLTTVNEIATAVHDMMEMIQREF